LSASLRNVRGLLCIPYISASSNGTLNISPVQSPFSSEPCTTSPIISLSNFNIQVNSMNLFQQNFIYGYEQFITETNTAFALNGGLGCFDNGLIDQQAFEQNHRYYFCNLARGNNDDSSNGKSIQILFQNNNVVNIDVHIFIMVQKTLIMNISSGEVIEVRS
jgi:hypothetical protein